MRLASCCCLLLALAACGERTAAPQADTPLRLEGMPAEPAPTPAAAPAAPPVVAAAVSDRHAAEAAGWRTAFELRLPALAEPAARRVRRAAEAWLFQGLVEPRASFAETAAEAQRILAADAPHPGAGDPWYCERAVVATRLGGGWLALARSERSSAGAGASERIEGMVVAVDEVRALTLDEIVPPERQEALRAILAGELRRARGLPADGPLTELIASDAELPIPQPLIDDEGARFVWNAYEIAQREAGAFTVRLAAERLRPLLAADPWR
jgi:hypothetical protein